MDKKILVVEDEQNIVDILSFNLAREGYQVLTAMDGKAGLSAALTQDPDLVLLDLMLPEMDGIAVCRGIREAGRSTPVIMLTAREGESDKVLGLETGADDYITKPFSMRELLSRVKTNLRRSDMLAASGRGEGDKNALRFGRLTIRTDSCSVTKDGKPVELTQREFELLRFLASQPEKVFSREDLMNQVWNYGYVGDVRTVDVTVRRLREKIEDTPAAPKYIITRRGMGYYFAAQS